MKYTHNLATRSYVNRRTLYLSYALLGALMTVVLLLNTIRVVALNNDINRNSANVATIEAKFLARTGVADADYNEANYQKMLASIQNANEILQQDSFRWTSFLDQMESVVPRQVRILRIDPNHSERSVKLSGQAITLKYLQVFIDNIIESGDYSQVFLERQSNEAKSNVIKFSIMLEGAF